MKKPFEIKSRRTSERGTNKGYAPKGLHSLTWTEGVHGQEKSVLVMKKMIRAA